MGCPIQQLYATNTQDETGCILVSAWEPVKKEDGKYYMPPHTPIGLDIWLPNVLDLKPEEGAVKVKVQISREETGIWLYCYDDSFSNEKHLCNYKPGFKEGTKRPDHKLFDDNDDAWEIHIASDIPMVAGDGPISITLVRKEENGE